MSVSGFRVDFRFESLGSRISVLGFRVDLGFRV